MNGSITTAAPSVATRSLPIASGSTEPVKASFTAASSIVFWYAPATPNRLWFARSNAA